MTQRKKLLLRIAALLAGALLLLVVVSVLVLQSAWFAGFVREKIIATVEESTGGSVELQAFEFDWTHLTARLEGFVLHGTEPAGEAPLAQVKLLEVRLKLLSGLKKVVDIRYLGIDTPQINFIVFADGKTNVPEPKVKKPSSPSSNSGLETVVNLAVGKFLIDHGSLHYSQRKVDFAAQGEHLRLLLEYSLAKPSYEGKLSIDPLVVRSGPNKPLEASVNVPLSIENDAVRITDAKIATPLSQILLNASLGNLKSPAISAKLNANISLPEMQTSFALPLDTTSARSPKTLTLAASVQTSGDNVIQVKNADLALGATTVHASGTMNPADNSQVDFRSNFALPQLASLLKAKDVKVTGALHANGSARFDRQKNYIVNGRLNSEGVSVESGTTRLRNVSLVSPFHADPFLISLDGLKLNALGGSLAAKLFIENMERLSLETGLRGFYIPGVVAAVTGKNLDYSGTINGTLRAQGDLKAKGVTGFSGQANLSIVPGNRGVPLSGRLTARFDGARNLLDLGKSYVAMPHTRLELSGALNRQIDVNLLSRNLNDFLPAANFGAVKPQTSLPVTLTGRGTAALQAQIKGDLSAPRIQSHLAVNNFAAEGRAFNRLALDLKASPSGASVTNGALTRRGLQTAFDASIGLRKWSPIPRSPLSANVTIRDGNIADLLSLAGDSSVPATGQLAGDIHVNGTYGNPLGSAKVQIADATAYDQAIDHVYLNVDLVDRLIKLTNFEVAAAGAQLNADGTFRHPSDSFSTGHLDAHVRSTDLQLANIRPLQEQSPSVGGLVNLAADITGDLRNAGDQSQFTLSNVKADLNAHGLKVRNQDAGDLTARARTQGQQVAYNVTSDLAGSNIKVNGTTGLTASYPTKADARISDLSIRKVLLLAGQGSVPATGTLSADAHVSGTLDKPDALLNFAFKDGEVYQEKIDSLGGRVQYTDRSIEIPSLALNVPAGSVNLHGAFTHPSGNLNNGDLKLVLDSSDIQIAKIEHATAAKPGIAGVIKLAADVAARVQDRKGAPALVFSRLNSEVSAKRLQVGSQQLGQLVLNTKTKGQSVDFRLDSNLAKSAIHAAGSAGLTGNYPTRASLTFANIRYVNIAPFLSADNVRQPRVDALVEGKATVNGPMLNTDDLAARLQLDTLELRTVPRASPTGAPPNRTVAFKNQGPVVIALNKSVVNIDHFDIEGPKTSLKASGAVNLKKDRSPIALSIDGNADLGILQDTNRDFYASGLLALNAKVRGSLAQPLLNGQIELKNANVNYAQSPNGLSNANGVILLNGTSATIQNLTGESGGGQVALSGFAGYNSNAATFNLQAKANRVRVRVSGVSVTSDADILLTGNSKRSLASGEITLHKISYGSSSDAGSFLTRAGTPPSTPSSPSPLLAGMRLDVRIVTAPDLRVVTTYADRLGIEANLAVRGTAASPGVLGNVSITDGELVFFGNKYTVNTGTVNFYNANTIQPIVNFSLQTVAQNVNVVLGVTGPVDNLALSYRSDPPLTFQQIVQLLATNTTPNDPTIAARQPAPAQQSLAQMGSSAILGQAVANPLASRVQRVFGLSAFKIDPSVAGANGQPTAKLTLEQKIASAVTFTYITDVTQTNSQIIKVEWALTPKLSAVGLRDYNGNVSIQFFYKFKLQ